MKNLLRNLTLAALVAAPAFYASAAVELKEVYWGKSTVIGETWVNATLPGMNARFATGKDGKFYTIDMEKNAIISFEGTAGSEEVSEPTIVKTFTLPEGITVAGSSLSIDANGNFIFNFNFVQSNPSPSQAWGMYNPKTDKLYYYTIPAEQCVVQRIDHLGRVVGDASSAEGAYGYAFGATAKYPVVYHFTTKDDVFNVTCAPLTDGIEIATYNQGANGWAQPSVSTVAEIAAAPTTSYYGIATLTTICTIVDNKVVYPGLPNEEYGIHIGNSTQAGFDTFILNGKRYFVRSFNNNKDWWDPSYGSQWNCVLNFAVFNEEGKIVAEWQKSDWKQSTGFASINAEVVNETTANIYVYISGTHDNIKEGDKTVGAKTQGSNCVMCTLTYKEDETPDDPTPEEPTKHVLKGSGTEADPYLIATADDLCAAHLYIPQEVAGDVVYFKQTANIDMAGITDWQALNGWYGSYAGKLYYDGNYNVIYNFAPVDGAPVREKAGEEGVIDYDNPNFGHYYDTSIFGVLRGTVKNLGVIDANIEETGNFDGAAIIADYSGQGGVEATIENVFVTGKVKGLKRIGGIGATAGANNTLKNVYAVVELDGPKGLTAGIIGNTGGQTFNINGGYVVANPVEGTTCNLIAGGTSGTVTIPSWGFEAYGDGKAVATDVKLTNGTDELAVDEELDSFGIKGLQTAFPELFSDKKMLGGYPTFNWVTNAQLLGLTIAGNGTEASPYLISSADELGQAYQLIPQTETTDMVYFQQTADIDMAGVEDYQALNGWGGAYYGKFSYDGAQHVIRNFGPNDREADATNKIDYYCQTLFGVASGEIKNLGVVDCNIENAGQGLGALGAYAGHSNATGIKVDNVFVTGTLAGSNYTGGFFGTNGNTVDIANSYAVVTVESPKFAGGFVGRLSKPMTIKNSYVAATVSGAGVNGLIAGSNAEVAITCTDVVAVGTGDLVKGGATVTGITAPVAAIADAKATIQGWAAFNENKEMAGYPTLNWMTEDQISGVEDVIADEIGVDNNAPVEYYNLQGVRVENPANGLYIKRQGKTVTKVVIR